MITRVTLFVILVLSLATYASHPAAAASSAHANPAVVCCDGDPIGLP
jgi:hypothetical protein